MVRRNDGSFNLNHRTKYMKYLIDFDGAVDLSNKPQACEESN